MKDYLATLPRVFDLQLKQIQYLYTRQGDLGLTICVNKKLMGPHTWSLLFTENTYMCLMLECQCFATLLHLTIWITSSKPCLRPISDKKYLGGGVWLSIYFFFVKNSSQGEQCTARVGITGLDRSHSLHQGLGYAWCDAPWTSAALELLRLQLQVNSRNITIVYGKLSEITISPTRVMQLKQFACWLAKNGHTKCS